MKIPEITGPYDRGPIPKISRIFRKIPIQGLCAKIRDFVFRGMRIPREKATSVNNIVYMIIDDKNVYID